MPDDPDKVETGCDYHPKGHHFNMKKTSRHSISTITNCWVRWGIITE